MPLLQRRHRPLGDDWVQPRGAGRWTAIGNLDSPWRGLVDPAGLVTLAGATWSLDWWIGAEDRWHLACREVAVRQSLVGASPVVETRLRVPGGDAVHRAYAARDQAGHEALVVEIDNQSKLPFAVALAIRPHGQGDPGQIREIALDGTEVRVEGRLAVVLPRSPGRVALSDARSGDSATVVLAGEAAPVAATSVSCRAGLASAALLFPLAHTATLRVTMPLPPHGAREPGPVPATVPSAAQVASGWSTHVATGARTEVPDRRLRDAVAASARHLLLGAADPTEAAALDLLGFSAEAARLLLADPATAARSDRPGASLNALARHWELTRDTAFATGASELTSALVARLGRVEASADRSLGVASLPGAAALFDAAGERRAASDVRALVAREVPSEAAAFAGAAGDEAPEALVGLLSSASSTWTWAGPGTGQDLSANARLVALVRALLVREEAAGLALSPSVPEGWLGQGWELHDAPTRHGRLSYAVRWHADRPALLWELDPHDAEAVTITVPGLDPAWSSTERRGEALLAPVALPERAPRRGLTIPVAIEPMPGRRS